MTPKKIPTIPGKHRDRVDMAKVPSPQFIKTLNEWLELDVVIQPADIFLLERQDDNSLKAKVSDGINLYKDIPYLVDSVINTELYNLLYNHNNAGGVLVLNDQTKIPESFLPTIYTGRVKVVDTYNEMVSGGEDDETGHKFKQGPVIVLDATGDPSGSVQSGGGYYVWVEDTDITGWIKISEFHEPEVTLEEYFKYTGDSKLTIGVISDDVNDPEVASHLKYKKFSYADAERLNSLSQEGDTISVKYTHVIYCTEIDMAKFNQILQIS